MNAPTAQTHANHHLADLHARFASLLPRIETHGRIVFRHVRCPHQKAELLQEMRSLAWKWFVRLDEQGKDVNDFVTVFISFLARAVNSGRRITGLAKAKDGLNPMAQKRHGFNVETLETSTATTHEQLYTMPRGQKLHDAYEERLRDNTITPIPDQVQFRIDWPAWLATLTARERRMIQAMALSERTLDISHRFEVSAARISQMRREFYEGWNRFCGEPVAC